MSQSRKGSENVAKRVWQGGNGHARSDDRWAQSVRATETAARVGFESGGGAAFGRLASDRRIARDWPGDGQSGAAHSPLAAARGGFLVGYGGDLYDAVRPLPVRGRCGRRRRSEEHTSELQSL